MGYLLLNILVSAGLGKEADTIAELSVMRDDRSVSKYLRRNRYLIQKSTVKVEL